MARSVETRRVFVDANVLIAGSAFPRWPYEVLHAAFVGDLRMVLCPLVIEDARRHLKKSFPDQLAWFERFLERTEYELVENPSRAEIEANKTLVRDLSDVPVALAAIAARVDYLVSTDKDLTAEDETTAELRRHLKVRIPGTFLREVMGWRSEQLEAIRYRNWREMPDEITRNPRR